MTRLALKRMARFAALIAVTPLLAMYRLQAALIGRDRALEGASQTLALLPGLTGQYLRRAFLMQVLDHCHPTATVEFGTVFSQTRARLEANVYVGPRCHLGLVHLEQDALLGPGVHVPSGSRTHGTADPDRPIREQPGERECVRIGAGAWVGSAAVILADVGANSIIGAGAVVTKPVPADVVAAGVPAKVVKHRRLRTYAMSA